MDFEISDLRDQNPWWKNKSEIEDEGRIKDYEKAKYKWNPRLKETFNFDKDVIYTLRGPRQVGKTTLTKLKIRELLEDNDSKRIFYYSCDMIDSKEDLVDLLETYIDWIRGQTEERLYLFLDEISSVEDWQEGIKHLKDIDKFENCTLLLTGSHSLDIEEGGETLPGRRGAGAHKNKVLAPMKFAEYLEVVRSDLSPPKPFSLRAPEIFQLFKGNAGKMLKKIQPHLKDLNNHLNSYLKTGGFPKSIDQYNRNNEIDYETYEIYQRVVFGEIFKRDYNKRYLRDIIQRIIETRCTRVGWDTLKKNTSIKHHNTVKKYVELLKRSFILNLLYKVNLNKNSPKTNAYKKVYFSDPFIFHSMKSWLRGFSNPFKKSAESLEDNEFKSKIIEEVVLNHIIRLAFNLNPSDRFDSSEWVFYWTNSKEIDFILRNEGKLYPFEVKYRKNIDGVGKWICKRFDEDIRPIIVSKDKFEIRENCTIIPASFFLYLI